MQKGRLPRILIVTAGYGEGHNSAARGVRDALAGRAEVRVTDLCAEAMPRMFRLTRAAYLWTISRMPRLWKWMYEVSDRRNMAEKPVRGIAPVERLLERLLREWKPDAVVCTYMVYPYMLDSLASRTGRAVPYLTVVTDSFVINKSWLCSKSPLWAVTDPWTRAIMEEKGLPQDRLRVTGFPVNPVLGALAEEHPLSWKEGEPFRVLYFAQRSARHARAELAGMLDAIRPACNLYSGAPVPAHLSPHPGFARQIRTQADGARLDAPRAFLSCRQSRSGRESGRSHRTRGACGRTSHAGELSSSGPGGGQYPPPGKLGGGSHVPDARALASALQEMMADGGAQWRRMHENLLRAGMTGGSGRIADLALKLAEEHTN